MDHPHVQKCREWMEKLVKETQESPVVQRAVANPRPVIYGIGFFFTAIWLLVRVLQVLQRKKQALQRPATPDLEKPAARSFKAPTRPLGVWTPMDFKRPTAPPSDWNHPPRPYRPFRHGPYHITMGLRNMDWDEWIELDDQYLKFHDDKATRIASRGSKCSHTDPLAYSAALELLSELCSYLPERYPTLFLKTPVGMNNLLTGETFNIIERPLIEDPMQMAGRMIQDDLAIMIEKDDGMYYLLAGSILLAGFWRLEDKFGMVLSEIHTSGDVPGFKEKLEKGMMNFFRRVQPNGPVQRNNYFIQVDDQLPWSPSIGSEDGAPGTVGWFTAAKNKAISHHYFRSERQTLRRLPRSGGVVFTIRTYFHPVTEICDEPGVPGRLASAVKSWGDDVSRYKGRERYGEVLLEYLDGRHAEQVKNGLVKEEEEEAGKGYPF